MSDNILRNEFDDWADAGKGESMADGHGDVTRQALDLVDWNDELRALDVGCGIGWAVGEMRRRGCRHVAGIDISPKMLHRGEWGPRTSCCVASAEALPFRDGAFDRVLSVESIYYYHDLDRALGEIRRVCRPAARFLCIVDLFADNPGSVPWADELAVPVHVLDEGEYRRRFEAAGFRRVTTERLQDTRPVGSREEFTPSRWFQSWDLWLSYRECGSLLIDAEA